MIKNFIKKILRKLHKTLFYKFCITIRSRYKLAKSYNKDTYGVKENVFSHIYKDNFWGSCESISGVGSEILTTVEIRKALPVIWQKYKIKTFLDVPCGDFNWMKEVDKTGIKYIGGDIVEKNVKRNNELYGISQNKLKKIDITKDILPKVDMVFCKDCLQHLNYENVAKALRNFMQSGCKYLMLTSYPLTIKNYDILDGDYRALNLFKEPFNLPKNYLYKVREKNRRVEVDKTMYLWNVNDIAERAGLNKLENTITFTQKHFPKLYNRSLYRILNPIWRFIKFEFLLNKEKLLKVYISKTGIAKQCYMLRCNLKP
jgi:ribosomal protein S26